jgi:hypothetical protein
LVTDLLRDLASATSSAVIRNTRGLFAMVSKWNSCSLEGI